MHSSLLQATCGLEPYIVQTCPKLLTSIVVIIHNSCMNDLGTLLTGNNTSTTIAPLGNH